MKYTKEEDKRSNRDTEILSRLKSHISGVVCCLLSYLINNLINNNCC